jgi:DNA-binding SARP family transcriptional activator
VRALWHGVGSPILTSDDDGKRLQHERGSVVNDSRRHAAAPAAEARGPAGLPYGRLFDGSPWGLLVTRPDGTVVGANRASRRMLGAAAERPSVRCCDLLGCGTPGSALADGCVSRLAASRPEPLPEVRVDRPPGGARGGLPACVWLTGARLEGGDDLVLLQLRPGGGSGDRRRRTEPQWVSGPRLRVHCLGATRVEGDGGTLGGTWLDHRPGRLLKYLVLRRGHAVPLDELLEVFGDDERRRTPGSIRQAVYVLRERVEPQRGRHDASAFVVARHGGYRLDTANVSVDVDDFEAHAGRGRQAMSLGDRTAAERHLTAAMALRHGELMSDEPYSEWVLPERDRLHGLAAQCLRALAEIRLAAGDLAEASRHTLALSELEPLDLDLQKDLLRLLLRGGRYSEAERRLVVIRRRFRRTLGEVPDLDLAALRAE